MRNIVDIIKGLGIEIPEDKEAELLKQTAENYKTIAEHEKRVGRLESERDSWKGKAETAEETLKGFEELDIDGIKNDLATWKKKAEDAEKDYSAKLYARDFDDALKAEIAGLKFTSAAARKAVEAEIRSAGLKLNDGKILGFSDLVSQIRERDADAFVDNEKDDLEAGKARFTAPATHSAPTMTKEQIMSIKDATERQAKIIENIKLFQKE